MQHEIRRIVMIFSFILSILTVYYWNIDRYRPVREPEPDAVSVFMPTQIDGGTAKIREVLVADAESGAGTTDGEESVTNILLVGSDSRNGRLEGSRSDCMLLLSYNSETTEVDITSFLRDIWISIPDRGDDRLNAAFAYGGTTLLLDTINKNFDLNIEYYITVCFESFKSIVDNLGGIDVPLSEWEASYINTHTSGDNPALPAGGGVHRLNGTQALCHCRNRHSPAGDFDRTRRQRDLLLALCGRARALREPAEMAALLKTAMEAAKTNLPAGVLLRLGLEAAFAEDLSVRCSSVPYEGTWNYANKDGRSVIEIDLEKNRTYLRSFLYGEEEKEEQPVLAAPVS